MGFNVHSVAREWKQSKLQYLVKMDYFKFSMKQFAHYLLINFKVMESEHADTNYTVILVEFDLDTEANEK